MRLFDSVVSWVRAFMGEPLEKSLRRRLRAASPATIAELREGLHCRISGAVRALDEGSLESPLSGLPCVAYRLEIVEDHALVGEAVRDLVVYDKRAVPFLLVDGAHRALIDPEFSQILTPSDHVLRAGAPGQLPHRARVLLEQRAPHVLWNRTTRIVVRESIIELGDRVAVAGVGRREADPHGAGDRGYRDAIQDRLRFVGTPELPLLIGAEP